MGILEAIGTATPERLSGSPSLGRESYMNRVSKYLRKITAKWIPSRSIWIVLFSDMVLFAQFKVPGFVGVSVGVKAGVPLTDSFTSVTGHLPQLGITERKFSRAKHYLVGPAV